MAMQKSMNQSGMVLIICLVLLAIVTLLGVATMRSSGLETKMTANMRDRTAAFAAAEETLRVAEQWIDAQPLDETNSFYDGCVGDTCFNAGCINGLCAFYAAATPYNSGTGSKYGCNDSLEPPTTSIWQQEAGANVWLTDTTHAAVDPSNVNVAEDAKYIIEFLCYVTKDTSVAPGCETDDTNCAPQFRVTALASGLTAKTKVMLQTVYKKSN